MINSVKSKFKRHKRFKVKIDESNINYPYIMIDTKFKDVIVSNFKFEDDANHLCDFQNQNCTFGNFEFPKFMRTYKT